MQHDYDLANQTMPSARTDLNNLFQTIAGLNSGSSAPSTTFAYMLWADTTTGLLKVRNAANSAWIIIGNLATPGLNFKTHTANPNGAIAGDFVGQMCYDTTSSRQYVCTTAGSSGSVVWTPIMRQAVRVQTGTSDTILETDIGKLVTNSNASPIAVTLPQGTGLFGNGFFFDIQNRGAGAVTITPTTSTIDGGASIVLTQGQGARIFSDGTNYYTQKGVGGSSGLTLIQSQSPSGVATVDFTTGIGSTYDNYQLHLFDFMPAIDNVALWLRITMDGGSTWRATAADYRWLNGFTNTTYGNSNSSSDTKIEINRDVGNATNEGCASIINFWNPSGTSRNKWFQWDGSHISASGTPERSYGQGRFMQSNNAINGVRLLFSSGNIAGGVAKLYGVQK